ncbi:MAG: hypothetical protein QW348_06070 [Ignisphaera sp.]
MRGPFSSALAILLTLFVSVFAVVPDVLSESRLVYSYEYEGLRIQVYAPYQARAGGNIVVRVRVEALENLYSVTVYLELRGSRNYGYGSWSYGWYHLQGIDLSSGVVRDETYSISIPSDVDPSLIYGCVYLSWSHYELLIQRSYTHRSCFNVAYLTNLLESYQSLQQSYSRLALEYNETLSKYRNLISDYNNLKSMYSTLEDKYNKLASGYTNLQSNYTKLSSNYEYLNREYSNLSKKYNELQSSYSDLQTKCNAISNELALSKALNYTLGAISAALLIAIVILVARRQRIRERQVDMSSKI